MKRSILFLLSLCMLLITCSDSNDPIKEIEKPPVENKDPFITLKKSNIDFTNEGGSEAILIESNVTWTAKSSASWCTVSPSSGNKSTGSITLSAPANKDYDNRSCTVTIEGGGVTKTITVNQGENLGLLVTQDRYELSNEESTIKVEVKANVKFEVETNDEWITQIETRGLTTSEIEFKIAKNDTHSNREGSITIKQKGGDMESTITIFQSQEDAIILTEKNFELTNKAQSIELEVKSNIDYEIIIPEDAKDWVTHATTRALRTETVVLNIAENKDYDERSVEVIVKDKKTDLQETVTIKQAANRGLIVGTDKYEVSNDGGTIEVEVKANVEFDIEISDSWITQVKTRGLKETKLQFQVAKNKTYDNREGTITIKEKGGNLSSTIKVYQSQEDAIILTEKDFELSNKAQSIELEVKSNIDYEIIIPEAAKSWVSYIETRALRTETVVLNIADNKDYDERTVEIIVKDKKTDLQETVTIKQAANRGLIISDDKYELSNDGGTIEVEVKANVEFDIDISDNWITQVKTRGLKETKLQFQVAKNKTYDNREGTITIKEKGGNLSSTIKVYQSQQNAIILSDKVVEVSDRAQTLEVVLKTNVDFEVIIPESAKNWVSYTPTRGLRTETVLLNIAANEGYEARSTEIYIKDKKTSLQDTFTINQNSGKSINIIRVDKMGTLGTILNQTQKDNIIAMKIIGEINKADFQVMKSGLPKLVYIDLSDVVCENNEIPDEAFGAMSTYYYETYRNANKNINTIILPESITIIGESAFDDCSGLTGNLILPDGLTTIEKGAFRNCSGFIGNLNLPDGVTTIGAEAFLRCSGLTGKLNLPDGLTTIGRSAFSGCRGFTGNLILPDEVTTIGGEAFRNCSGFIGDLIIPDGVTTIEYGAFGNCSGFSGNLIIPDGVTTIGGEAFSGCRGFTGNLILPDKVTTIGARAFSDCSGLTGNLIIPDGVTTIGPEAFSNCSGFTGNLILPDGVTRIWRSAFRNCSGFIGDLIIPDGVTTIEYGAFSDCSGFTGNLILPDGVTTIEEYAFYKCSGFTGNLILPDGATTIGDYAFNECRGFTGNLILPDKVTTVGKRAFYNCSGLTGLTIGKNLTTIHENAFWDCRNIAGNIIFPASLTSIRISGFAGCYNVDAFQFPHTTPLGYYPNMLPKYVPVKVPNEAVSAYQSADGWKEHTIIGY